MGKKLLIFFVLLLPFVVHQIYGETEAKACRKKKFNRDSFVCVCDGHYCDQPEPLGELTEEQLVYYVTDKEENRLSRNVLSADSPADGQESKVAIEVRVNASAQFQSILGFGGAFTDSAGISLNALGEAARAALLDSYFHPEKGIGYSIGRVPVASCDFSTREYSYLDTPNDFDLTSFALAKEDLEDKIPLILAANRSAGGNLLLFSSPWSAPGWMKTSGRMKGGGVLKGNLDGPYYRTYANYFRRFFEEYASRNVSFWGMTIENEPGAGLVPFYSWQAMYISSQMQRDFANKLLSPALRQSEASRHVKIMGHDDQRSGILSAAKQIYGNPREEDAIDGLGSHWYSHSAYDTLSLAHLVRPDKFILATEACTGYLPWEHKPLLGDWARGMAYAHDILNNLRNWVVGWTDWNICLDLQGGPNWVRNFVDSPVIVNASGDQFYKQPMFYALAHFSRFVPRHSRAINSSLYSTDGTKLAHVPREDKVENVRAPFLADDDFFLGKMFKAKSSRAIGDHIEHVAFRTPDGNRVLVLLNSDATQSQLVRVLDQSSGRRWTLSLGPNSIVTAVWAKKAK